MAVLWRFGCYPVSLGPRRCRRVRIVLRGGPLDGLKRRADADFIGVLGFRQWPEGAIEESREWWYCRTSERTRAGRVVCRYRAGE